MKIRDKHISEELFSKFLTRLPQISVELFLEKDGEVLLAKRNNKPLKGEWFWPGSRLYKGEKLREAAHRVAEEELGIEVEIKNLLGVYSHYWEESAFENVENLHTVNIVYHVKPIEDIENITLDDQHQEYKFFKEINTKFSKYVKKYMKDSSLFNND